MGGRIKGGRRRNGALEERHRQRGCRGAMPVPFRLAGGARRDSSSGQIAQTGERRRRRREEATREGGQGVREEKRRQAGRQGAAAEAQAMQDAQRQDETRDTERNRLD